MPVKSYLSGLNNGKANSGGKLPTGTKIFRRALLFLISFCLVLLVAPAAFAINHGDLNGDGSIDVQDVALAMRHVLGLSPLTGVPEFLADVNDDGAINVQDVSQIMQKSLGLIAEFKNAPLSEPHLIDQFIVEAGLAPGNKLVVVSLAVDNQEDYLVFVGQIPLTYSARVAGFLAEVPEAEANLDRAAVYVK